MQAESFLTAQSVIHVFSQELPSFKWANSSYHRNPTRPSLTDMFNRVRSFTFFIFKTPTVVEFLVCQRGEAYAVYTLALWPNRPRCALVSRLMGSSGVRAIRMRYVHIPSPVGRGEWASFIGASRWEISHAACGTGPWTHPWDPTDTISSLIEWLKSNDWKKIENWHGSAVAVSLENVV